MDTVIEIGDKIHIPKAGIYEVVGVLRREGFDLRVWLMNTNSCDSVVLCGSQKLWVKLMGQKNSPVPDIMKIEDQQPVWCAAVVEN
jgi:hypothetical protein